MQDAEGDERMESSQYWKVRALAADLERVRTQALRAVEQATAAFEAAARAAGMDPRVAYRFVDATESVLEQGAEGTEG